MTRGRKTLYGESILKKARNYVTGYADHDDLVPSVAGLACVLGVNRDTCYAWASDPDKQEFSDILKELAQRQERVLLNKGLGGVFNAPITKMLLTKHGYSDKVETDVTSSDGSMTPKADLSGLSDAALAELVAARDASSKN